MLSRALSRRPLWFSAVMALWMVGCGDSTDGEPGGQPAEMPEAEGSPDGTGSDKDDGIGGDSGNYAFTAVDFDLEQKILSALSGSGVDLDFESLKLAEPRFVLHDTAGISSDSYYERLVAEGRGPLGHGPGVFIHRDGETFVTRPEIFSPRRPPSSYHERGTDILSNDEIAQVSRVVWSFTYPDAQSTALEHALDGLGLTAEEIESETEKALKELTATEGRIYTTSAWTIEHLCTLAEMELDGMGTGVDAVIFPGHKDEVSEACKKAMPYLEARNDRIGRALNIELIQSLGSDCFNRDEPVALEGYTDEQYKGAAQRYLQASLKAGYLPEVTTHFWDDRAFWGHCDPRCFDLDRFYGLIAEALGHPDGAQYGIAAKYGTRYGRHTIWWNEAVCGPTP
ncbi:MAG: hypothetical protein ACE366_17280 [Bradymonadia bacterium]